jgi:hypothetical protein
VGKIYHNGLFYYAEFVIRFFVDFFSAGTVKLQRYCLFPTRFKYLYFL